MLVLGLALGYSHLCVLVVRRTSIMGRMDREASKGAAPPIWARVRV